MKHSNVLPYAFTEHGVAMLSSVLNSERAIKVNILIVKTFVKIREIFLTHEEFSKNLKKLEQKLSQHDDEIQAIVNVIRNLVSFPEKNKRKIGFQSS